jgi:hypothetical protein
MTAPTPVPIVVVASGGLPVTEAANGKGTPVVIVPAGGLPVVGSGNSG